MFYIQVVFFVVLAHYVSFNTGRTVQDQKFQFDPTNGTRIQDSFVGEVSNLNQERKLNMLNESDTTQGNCPYKQKELCIILSLSKIAKVQIANPSHDTTGRNSKSNVFGDIVQHIGNLQNAQKIQGSGRSSLDVAERFKDDGLESVSRKQNKSPNVHCRAIRDVYIPEAKQHLPAFSCSFKNGTFILSSARFLQDRRSYLDINVDEMTFRNIKSVPKISRSNEINVIPALLVLKLGDNDYKIRTPENVSIVPTINQDKRN